MEQYDLTTQDLHNIREQFFDGNGYNILSDGVQFRDLLTQEPLSPGFIPSSVHDELLDGFNHLKDMGRRDRLHVHFLLGGHGSAEDFQEIVKHHAKLLDDHQHIGIEASWQLRNIRATADEVASATPHDIRAVTVSAESAPGRHEFQTNQLRWLWGRDKTILPCQTELNYTSDLAKAMDDMWSTYEQAAADTSLEPGTRNAVKTIAERTYQTHRQWMIVGQLGRWLNRLDEADALTNERTVVPIMLGKWHARSVDRLLSLGVSAEASFVPTEFDTDEWQRYGAMVMDCMFQATAPLDLLKAKVPY